MPGTWVPLIDGFCDVPISREKVACRLASGRVVEGHVLVGSDGANGIAPMKVGIRENWGKKEIALYLGTSGYIVNCEG